MPPEPSPHRVAAGRQIRRSNSGKPHSEKEVVKIPINLNGHKIYLKTKINNSRELNFILDTGAITTIDEKIAGEINLEKGTSLPSLDTSKSAYLSKSNVKISLGELYVDQFIPVIAGLPKAMSRARKLSSTEPWIPKTLSDALPSPLLPHLK